MSDENKSSACDVQTAQNETENKDKYLIYIARGNKTIFDEKYVIPIYQRAFAWDGEQIEQLVDDIYESADLYSLGTLTASEKDGAFYVVDGQQRLTALYLLLAYLKILDPSKAGNLSYQCRKDDTRSLEEALEKIRNDGYSFCGDDLASKVFKEIDIAAKKLAIDDKISDEEVKKKLTDNLGKVFLVRIILPPKTDLPAYFRVMNNSGKQLEAADIVKAKLMEKLDDEGERKNFNAIWKACANMDGYVKTHFDLETRGILFGEKAKQKRSYLYPFDDWGANNADIGFHNKEYKLAVAERESVGQSRHIFLGFSVFLLHALRLFEKFEKGIDDLEEYDIALDDKKLLAAFDRVIRGYGRAEVIKFGKFLLRIRAIFDDFVVHGVQGDGDKTEDDGDGDEEYKKWEISRYNEKYYHKKYKSEYIRNPFLNKCGDLMTALQNCLRVTYTAPKAMDWITFLLGNVERALDSVKNYDDRADDVANLIYDDAYEALLKSKWVGGKIKEYLVAGKFCEGTNTPHIVFNYLDFALWKMNKSSVEKFNWHKPNRKRKQAIDFQFAYRKSVEHFYPQNPPGKEDKALKRWKELHPHGADVDGLHSLGNLCVVSVKTNSRFSNMSPSSKITEFDNSVKNGSVKLRVMAKCVKIIGEQCKKDVVRTAEIWAGACREEEQLFNALGYKAHERFALAVLLAEISPDDRTLEDALKNYCDEFENLCRGDWSATAAGRLVKAVEALEKAYDDGFAKLKQTTAKKS